MSVSNSTASREWCANDMHVTKRNGNKEVISFDKILQRLKKLGREIRNHTDLPVDGSGNTSATAPAPINFTNLAMKVIDQLYDGIPTSEIDTLCADLCASLSSVHPWYGYLASRIVVSNHHKVTPSSFSKAMRKLYSNTDVHGKSTPLLSEDFYQVVHTHAKALDAMCDYSRDYLIDYFGLKTLLKAYLMRVKKVVIERPQHMWLRVAVALHGNDLERVKETYDLMSTKHFTHATPTLFNAGSPYQQLSSCFLMGVPSDSIEGIYDAVKECAQISKWSGGIGIHISNVRASGSTIRKTNGSSNGIVPMLKVLNATSRHVDQGGKRNGSVAVYLEPWHADVEMFLQMKRNIGDEELKARDLFYALYVEDLFMTRVKEDGDWTLMCPDECPGLTDVYGDQFVELYTKYEKEGRGRKTLKARSLWYQVLDSIMETGGPYIVSKTNVNLKSNQKNLGVIKSSNLCVEVNTYSDANETGVCNLASIGLPAFVDVATRTFDFAKLHHVARIVTYNLNRVIDLNFYPLEKARRSNMRHRPIGLGVQGLADVFMMMRYPFESAEAQTLNKQIFETIYHAALTESCTLAKRDGPYETFKGSPASKGLLQFDLWEGHVQTNDRYNWTGLKQEIVAHGLRNSYLIAPMPTASTASILGFTECFECITSNLYSRRTLSGEFLMCNRHLMKDLIQLGLWNEKLKNRIIQDDGSIQHIDEIPDDIKALYKTVWEIKMKTVIDMSADRGVYVCQSQSLNLWMQDPNYNNLTSMIFYAHSKKLKSLLYYLRRRAKASAQKFTVPVEAKNAAAAADDMEEEEDGDEVGTCAMCSA